MVVPWSKISAAVSSNNLFIYKPIPLALKCRKKKMALLSYILLILSYICIANSADPLGNFCNDQSTTKNTPILSNINTLLSKLVQTTAQTGFSATSYGKLKDGIYGLAQCRGDVSSQDCSTCIQDAASEIRKLCPNQTDARIWYDYCFLRYNSEDFLSQLDTSYGIFYYNVENVTEPKSFNKKLGALMDQIESQAVVPKNKGLGKGEAKLSPFLNIYALVQCTRDLPQLSCAQCLATAVGNFPNYCDSKKGCRVLYSSCYIRYELYPFFVPLNASENTSMVKHVYVVPKS